MSRIRRHGLSVVAPVALAATLLLVSCLDDPSGPGVQPGFLALAPSFESSAAGIVDVDSIHVTLVRSSDQTVALDTVVALQTESDSVDLSFTVMVSSSSETFTLNLECLSPTGEVVFSAGPLVVTATTSGSDNVEAEDVVLDYVGVGSNAVSVQILSDQDTVKFGDTLLVFAEALDGSGTVIEGTPIKWISHDTARAIVPDPARGLIVGNRERDWVHIEALLLTGPADTLDLIVEPVASAIAMESGDAQSGPVLEQLELPIVVEVTAIDGLGVPDVAVDFAASGSGSVGQASVLTSADGFASTTWTLGAGEGTQTATASVAGVGQLAFTATATAEVLFRDDFEDGNFDGWNCFDGDPQFSDGVFSVQNGALSISGQDETAEKICLAGDIGLTDYALEATVTNVGGVGDDVVALIVRADTVAGTAYAFELVGGWPGMGIVHFDQTDRWLGEKSVAVPYGQPFRLRVEVHGNTITAFVDGTPEFQFVDTGPVAGQFGLAVEESQARFDDVLVTTVGPPSSVTIPELRFTVQPGDAEPGNTISPAVVLTAYDATGLVDASFTGTVTVELLDNPGGGTLSGSLAATAVAGVATFSDLSIDLPGSGYSLYAWATDYLSAISAAFDVVSAQPQQVGWINTNGGNWSNGANWSTGAPPSPGDTAAIVMSGEYAVFLDTDATVAVLVLGDGVNQQGMSVIGQTLTVTDSLHVNEFAFLTLAGDIMGDGGIFVDGVLSWTTGTIGASTPQPFHILVPGQLALTGLDPKIFDQRQLTNYGMVEWIQGDIQLNNVTVSNEVGGYFGAYAEGSISGSGLMQNLGHFEKNGPDSTLIQVPFSNLDSLNIGAGYLVIENTFSHTTGSLLQGIGTLDVTNATISTFEGDIGPGASPGILSVEGDLTLGANTTVFVELDGLTVASEYDRLDVSGNLDLAGTLDIVMGFTPTIGNSFDVLGFGTVSGDFNTVNGLDIGGNLLLDRTLGATTMNLEAVSAGPLTVAWINASGGNWSDGANWDAGTAPTAADIAVVDLLGTYTVTLDAPVTVDSMRFGGIGDTQTLAFNGFDLTATSGALITATGVVNVGGTSTLSTDATITNLGTMTLSGSTIAGAFDNQGTVTVAGGTGSSITGAITTAFGSMLRLDGTTGGDASLTVASGFTNSGTIEFTGNFYNGLMTVSAGTLTNAVGATIQTAGGSGLHEFTGSIDNQGTIDVANLSLRINNSGGTLTTTDGTLNVASGLTLTVNGGAGGTTEVGTATVTAGAGTIDLTGTQTLDVQSDFTVPSGVSNWAFGGAVTVAGTGVTTIVEGALSLSGDIVSTDLDITATGTVTVAGGTGSSITGAITTAFGSMLRLDGTTGGDASLTVASGFTNSGTIEFTGNFYNGLMTVSAGTLTNAVGATIQTAGGSGLHEFTGSIDNQGTIDVANLSLRINNSGGTLTTTDGTLNVASGLTLTVNGGAGGTTEVGTATVTAGAGTIDLTGTQTLDVQSDFTVPSGVSNWAFGGAVTVAGTGVTTIVEGALSLSGDIVSTDLDITATGTVTVAGGTGSSITGAITTAFGSMLRLDGTTGGDASLTVASGFTNSGTIEFTGNFYNGLMTVSAGTLTNAVGATIQTAGGSGLHEFTGSIDNQGTIDVANLSLRINNSGGTLTTTDGTLNVASGLTLTVNGGAGGTTEVGTATVTAGAGTIDLTGTQTLDVQSDFTVPSGVSNWAFGGAVTVAGTGVTTIVEGALSLSGDIVSTDLDITATGTVTVAGGTGSSITGAITTAFGSMLRLDGTTGGDASLTVASGFTNSGTIEFTGNFYNGLMTVSAGTLTNAVGATIQTAGGSGLHEFTGSIDNQGTIDVANLSLRINNSGGTLTTTDGTLNVASGLTLTVNGGAGGTTEVGTATVTAGAGTIDLTGTQTLDVQSDFTVPSGVSNWAFGGAVTVAGTGVTTIVEGALSLSGDIVSTDLDITATGTVTVAGGTGSSITGAITTAFGSMLRLDGTTGGDASLTVASGFTNSGTIEFTGNFYNGLMTVSAGTLTNAVGATIQTAGGSGLHEFTGSIDNQGTISVANLSLRITVSADLTNSGTTTVASGLTLTATGGTFTNTSTGSLAGEGTLDVSATTFTNSGITSPNTTGTTGVLTFDNVLPLDAQSTVELDLNGLVLGTDYDRVAVSGTATLTGTLNVTVGFATGAGDTFRVLTSTALLGTFSSINAIGLPGGLILDPAYTATYLDLVVVAVPPAIAFTWEGGTSTDWNEPDNWNPIGVPIDINNVWIRQAPANQPVVSVNSSVGGVVVQTGASVTIDPAVVLSVFGDLDAGSSIVGDGTVRMQTSGTTITGTVSNLDIQEDVNLNGPVTVTGTAGVGWGRLTLDGNTMSVAGAFSTSGSGTLIMSNAADILNVDDATFSGVAGILSEGTLNITGDFVQSSFSDAFAASGNHRTVFNGTGAQTIDFANPGAAASHFQEMEATNSAAVSLLLPTGSAFVNGSLSIMGSSDVTPGCGEITVEGDLSTSESGTLTMTCDDFARVAVNGNASFGGGSTDGRLTEGLLTVGGNFTQSGNASSFAASIGISAGHETELSGTAAQTVSFANPDPAQSRFYTLRVAQTGSRPGVTLTSDIVALNYLSTTGDSSAMQTIAGTGRTLTVGGLDVDGLELDEAILVWTDAGTYTGNFNRFAVLRFLNHAATDTRMNVIHAGRAAPYPFEDMFYQTESVDGYYLRAEDNDGIVDFLTVNLDIRTGSGTCWDPGNFLDPPEPGDYLEVNGADISDVAFFCQFS